MSDKLKILFLCTGNSCRSQMAEGWAHHLRGDVIEAYSAGVETGGLDTTDGLETRFAHSWKRCRRHLWARERNAESWRRKHALSRSPRG